MNMKEEARKEAEKLSRVLENENAGSDDIREAAINALCVLQDIAREKPKRPKPASALHYVATINAQDVEAGRLVRNNKHIRTFDAIGYLTPSDIGKRVYTKQTGAGLAPVVMVENDEQLHRRKERRARLLNAAARGFILPKRKGA